MRGWHCCSGLTARSRHLTFSRVLNELSSIDFVMNLLSNERRPEIV